MGKTQRLNKQKKGESIHSRCQQVFHFPEHICPWTANCGCKYRCIVRNETVWQSLFLLLSGWLILQLFFLTTVQSAAHHCLKIFLNCFSPERRVVNLLLPGSWVIQINNPEKASRQVNFQQRLGKILFNDNVSQLSLAGQACHTYWCVQGFHILTGYKP